MLYSIISTMEFPGLTVNNAFVEVPKWCWPNGGACSGSPLNPMALDTWHFGNRQSIIAGLLHLEGASIPMKPEDEN
jgi:hypothetical protein